ncbi:hypothetical protein RN629_04155 [Sphingomonadaceae bacterium jetA1]|jgi:hypothetical protein|uniref:hypothetical protein n=1 Tax=Facivitalis istanbulensis TaxID=3075838 RepID=UPI00347F98A0
MTFTATPSSHRYWPALVGGAIGVLMAFLVLIAPGWRLEMLVGQLGLGDVIAAARPPLGLKARMLLACIAGGGAGAVVWAAAYLLWGPGGLLGQRAAPQDADAEGEYIPSVRRSDRHPDAPPRRPLHAAELGAPPPPLPAVPATPVGEEDTVERTLPADLDQPLAAFDPEAILSTPREPVRPASRPGSHLAPEPGPMPMPPMREPEQPEQGAALPLPDRDESIETLLERLERETARRKARRFD